MSIVLIMGGKPSLGTELTSALSEAGFGVTSALSYFDGMWRVSGSQPDLVILNVESSSSDGWEVCQWLTQTFGTPVIILGRDTSDDVWMKAVQAGADCYLKIPLSRAELTARVKSILRRYKKD